MVLLYLLSIGLYESVKRAFKMDLVLTQAEVMRPLNPFPSRTMVREGFATQGRFNVQFEPKLVGNANGARLLNWTQRHSIGDMSG